MALSRRWTGSAAIVAGTGVIVGQAGEVALSSPSSLVEILLVACFAVGVSALAVALWGIHSLVARPRLARIGLVVSLLGAGLLIAFAVQVIVELARTGDVPEAFVLFLLGFLLLVVGQLLFARGLGEVVTSHAWILPVVASVAVLVALSTPEPVHNIGLFAFGAAWVALGTVLLRRWARPAESSQRPL